MPISINRPSTPRPETNHSKLYVSLAPFLLLAFLAAVTLITLISLNRLETETRKDSGQALETIRDMAREAVSNWILEMERDMDNRDSSPALLKYLEPVPAGSAIPVFNSDIIFQESHAPRDVLGFAAIRPDFTVSGLSGKLKGRIGGDGFLGLREKLAPVFKGVNLFIPPVALDLSGTGGEKTPAIIFASPIAGKNGSVAGALLMISDPGKGFTRIMRFGRLGKTGETFALNSEGKLITESRFHDQLVGIGLLSADQPSILNITLKDPGGNLLEGFRPKVGKEKLPFAALAKSALAGNTDFNVEGFRDYRGVRVLGAWMWDRELGIGFGAKMEEAEALEGYNHMQSIVTKTIFAITALSILLSLMLGASRKRFERSLIAAKDEAEKASRAKTVFLSSMSHELRTPLTAIIGFSDQLRAGSMGPLTAGQADAMSRIESSGAHLLSMVNDVLDLARIESGAVAAKIEEVDLEFAVTRAICDVEPFCVPLKTRITVERKFDDLKVLSDSSHLARILVNLLSNAIKYGPPGGMITISWEALEGSFVRLNVTDQGGGISPEKMDGLFQPFNRLGKEGLNIKGTGIGLTLSNKLAGLIGGKLGVTSKVGQGTVFHLDIPLTLAHRVGKIAAPPPEESPGGANGPMTILYIEDDPDMVALFAQVLMKKENAALISATTGAGGIALARSRRPKMIFLDIGLPDIDGFETLKRLKTFPETAQIPVIALSVRAMKEEIDAGMKAGFNMYITKPIYSGELLGAVDKFR